MSRKWKACVRTLQPPFILLVVAASLVTVIEAQERSSAPDSAIAQEIMAIENLKNEAMQKGDAKTLEQIYADDLVFINARGKMLTKDDRVKEFNSGNVKYISFRQGDYRFHVYGNTAIVTGLACSAVDYHGVVNRIPRRFTSVYVKLDGRWCFVAHQATLVSVEESGNLEFCKKE